MRLTWKRQHRPVSPIDPDRVVDLGLIEGNLERRRSESESAMIQRDRRWPWNSQRWGATEATGDVRWACDGQWACCCLPFVADAAGGDSAAGAGTAGLERRHQATGCLAPRSEPLSRTAARQPVIQPLAFFFVFLVR